MPVCGIAWNPLKFPATSKFGLYSKPNSLECFFREWNTFFSSDCDNFDLEYPGTRGMHTRDESTTDIGIVCATPKCHLHRKQHFWTARFFRSAPEPRKRKQPQHFLVSSPRMIHVVSVYPRRKRGQALLGNDRPPILLTYALLAPFFNRTQPVAAKALVSSLLSPGFST